MPVTAYANSTLDSWVSIEAPYNNKFVRQIKSDIPAQARRWVPDVKCTNSEYEVIYRAAAI